MGKITLQMIWDQNQDHTVKSDLKIKIKIKITSVISNQNHIFARKIRSKSRSLFSSPPFPRFVLKFHFASGSKRGGDSRQNFFRPNFLPTKNFSSPKFFPVPNFFLSHIFRTRTKLFLINHKFIHLFQNILQLLQLS